MKTRLLFCLITLLGMGGSLFAQEGTPVKSLFGSGPPAASLIGPGVVGTQYVDQSTSPPTVYVCTVVTIANPAKTCTWTASSSGSSSPGVFSVLTYGASSALSDNAAAFALASTAANAANLVPGGTPVLKNSAQSICASCASLNPSYTIAAGDAVLVWLIGVPTGRTVTVTDTGSNLYSNLITSQTIALGTTIQLWATAASGATASASSITASISGANAQLNAVVISFTNVGSYRFMTSLSTSGTSTTPSLTETTGDTNNILVSAAAWFLAATTVTVVPASGTVQQSFPSSATNAGGAVITQASATRASITNSVTLNNAGSKWVMESIELRSRTLLRPTLYIPPGVYTYSSGLQLNTGTILCSTAELNYVGSAHAADLGESGLTSATKNLQPVGVDGCDFTGGAAMTEGIYANPQNTLIFVRNSTFKNFGNSTAHSITGSSENWDMEIGPQNRWFTTDQNPRPAFINNQAGGSANSFARIHDNLYACWIGDAVTLGCNFAQGALVWVLDGSQNRFYHNNFAFGTTIVRVICTNSPCYGNQIDQNIFETAGDASASAIVQYGGNQIGLLVTQNVANLHGSTNGFIAPVGGSDTLQGARINFNTLTTMPAATPVVVQNNVVGQTGNYSYTNECGTALTAVLPCPLTHTAGGNIAQWNRDQWPPLTFAAGTTASYTFDTTYSVAPKCTIPPNITGTATTLTITTLNTTTLTITASASNSATVTASCSSGDAQ